MAGSGRRGGGDRILESRHLVGLFLGVVLLCGVFFTLGYVMGRTQYGGSVHAEAPLREAPPPALARATPKTADTGTASTPAPSEWDFYAKKDNDHLEPATQPDSSASDTPAQPAGDPAVASAREAAPKPVLTPVKNGGRMQSLKPAKPSILLQVAALRHQSDALAMAELLQKKRFPSFVSAPSGNEKLYRVQVGPYADERAADTAKTALDHAGFKAIIKR